MCGGKLWFVLLLRLFLTDSEGVHQYLVKTIGKELDVTPLCTNKTGSFITFIICKIRTEMSRGKTCCLFYDHGQDFVHECDSRFTLVKENHTVFLHLINLTPKESGNHTCECSYVGGTQFLHLNITVKDKETSGSFMTRFIFIATSTALIIVTGVVLGLILRKIHSRSHTRSSPYGLSNEDNPDDQYTSLRQPEGDLYRILECHQHKAYDKMPHSAYSHKATANLEQELSRKAETETDHTCEIYENI
ncbi:uncharacterized protein LOC125000565 [Mugil cephalus]|uniref:uncharacterized protein LOC125000565 n=1 Tax=Mugil cephalus TaxID=48193 RepID=UPI001FB7E2F8|nr:uncharacterized protein LOC125000565 [Mugil cephalus]